MVERLIVTPALIEPKAMWLEGQLVCDFEEIGFLEVVSSSKLKLDNARDRRATFARPRSVTMRSMTADGPRWPPRHWSHLC